MSKTYWGVEHLCGKDGQLMEQRAFPELHWTDDERISVKCDVCGDVVATPHPRREEKTWNSRGTYR